MKEANFRINVYCLIVRCVSCDASLEPVGLRNLTKRNIYFSRWSNHVAAKRYRL